MTISKDRVKPSPLPDSWKLTEIFATGVVIGTYLALTTVIFYYGIAETSFFAVNASGLFYNLLDLRVTFSIYHSTTFWMTLVIYDTKLQVT